MDSNIDPNVLTLKECQIARLEGYARRHEEKRCRYVEEMLAAGKGTSGTHENDEGEELLGGNTGALRDQFKIVSEGR